jgi:hypothetical protein
MRSTTSSFFHQTTLSGPLIHGLCLFEYRFEFAEILTHAYHKIGDFVVAYLCEFESLICSKRLEPVDQGPRWSYLIKQNKTFSWHSLFKSQKSRNTCLHWWHPFSFSYRYNNISCTEWWYNGAFVDVQTHKHFAKIRIYRNILYCTLYSIQQYNADRLEVEFREACSDH